MVTPLYNLLPPSIAMKIASIRHASAISANAGTVNVVTTSATAPTTSAVPMTTVLFTFIHIIADYFSSTCRLFCLLIYRRVRAICVHKIRAGHLARLSKRPAELVEPPIVNTHNTPHNYGVSSRATLTRTRLSFESLLGKARPW